MCDHAFELRVVLTLSVGVLIVLAASHASWEIRLSFRNSMSDSLESPQSRSVDRPYDPDGSATIRT